MKIVSIVVLSSFMVFTVGCSVKHENEVVNGTFAIEPVAVPREIHVHTKDGQTMVRGEIEPLAYLADDAEGVLRLEIIGKDSSVLEKQDVCFAPSWEQQAGPRGYVKSVYKSPNFNITLSKVPPKGSTFRFTVISFGEGCATNLESNNPLVEVNNTD